MNPTKEYIDHFLKQCFFATLSYEYNNGIMSHLMIFSHTDKGIFFLTSDYEKELLEPILNKHSCQVSLLIYKEEEYLDLICQVHVLGEASLVDKSNQSEYKEACDVIGEKSPLIKNLSQANHIIIKIQANTLSCTNFKDIREKKPPTVLKRI